MYGMKISGRNIKRRLYGLRMLPSNLKRARYFRGHGVHSPFVYAVVRQVFMRRKLNPEAGTALYDALLSRGISQRRAIQLQNLMAHCGYECFDIDCDPATAPRSDMIIATTEVMPERLKENFEAGNIILTKEEIAAVDAKLDTMSFDVFGGHSAK